ncbi:MAG: Glyoxylase, beta-lactamase superfamily II [Chloroflexi bacterium]|jgi:hydroxyacylglutathione hydrolase|nr:MAG: Glyoxylase, beta-lactamase superfamily II [Chloroflexota bacterium]
MILEQYYLGCLAHASYLIGDTNTGTAVVVDPQRDVDQYLEDAARQGLTIRHVFLTHFHADFVAGHLELRDRVGAEVHLGARADAEYAATKHSDGETLEFGGVRLQVLETPGHTPEGICILVFDLESDAQKPQAILTGDTLFIGDVGRPDLMASVGFSSEELAAMLYDSLHDKLLTLPDDTLVYPAHGAGSMCGRNLSTDTSSTLGTQRQYNYALQPMSKEAFIGLVTVDQPEAPTYFAYDAALNRREHATLDTTREHGLAAMTLAELLARREERSQVLDVRDPAEYEGAHVPGSINIGLGGSFATWAGTLLDTERPIVIIAEPEREREAAVRLSRVGFDMVQGYLEGGMQALESRPDLVIRTERIAAANLSELLTSTEPPVVIDVRTVAEWNAKHIEDSLNLPLNNLHQNSGSIPKGRRVVVHCAAGYRSAIAASILENAGVGGVTDLVGGLAAWEASNLATVSTLES